jgi:hypothetical protein
MRIFLLAVLFAILGFAAHAQERPALRFDPNRIEFATPWAQSSPCLGDRTDPICTAQTVVACGILTLRAECVGRRYGLHHNPQRHDRIEYRIVRAGIVPFERLEEMQENLIGFIDVDLSPMTARRAVIAQIVIRWNMCPASEASCEGYLASSQMVAIERTRRVWAPVTGGSDADHDWYAD